MPGSELRSREWRSLSAFVNLMETSYSTSFKALSTRATAPNSALELVIVISSCLASTLARRSSSLHRETSTVVSP